MVKACFKTSCFKAFFLSFEEVNKSSKKSRRALRPSSSAADSRTESELNIELPLATNEQDGHTDFCEPVRDKVAEESQTNKMQTHVDFGTQTYMSRSRWRVVHRHLSLRQR